ncbi:glycoside hydrolase family 2 TIM barrel-domain containing protein [uncultured Muribaculum sp.]|uniref:glycoside hydrolase family 2 TIM barrel-domain containing protein n=1 Tax=uncultured Muribaculum sp. TaxID=1918613 RepID=UPI002597B2A9|nr:glycoside hydrolase family 2 TIM barrel-domain containing protein [uncultured Muribaculum sp.]
MSCHNRENASDSSREEFNTGWRFALIDNDSVASPAYDDSNWRKLNLPHDWAIEGDFSESNPSGTGGGALPGGIGWYRKDFVVPESDKGKQIYIDFDGAYMNASVYVNGNYLGTRPYGYASFSYDISPYVKYGEENVIAVKVDNAEQPNSRWYSGCGIYRNVWMRVLDPIHVAQWGQAVIATVNGGTGTLDITTEIENNSDGDAAITISSNLIAPDGKKVAESAEQTVDLSKADSITTVSSQITLKNPRLWSTDTPDRYTLVTVIKDAATGKTLDTYSTVTGFRTFEFDAEKGFSLNGKPMKINGVCLHHDAGALGAVVNRRAIERQLEIMKEMGVNAIRSSHNPPAPELLELCDSMGLMVMDETFDMWRKKKTAHDYSRYFDEWHEKDLTDLVKRDRNHPSVFMWSIGNEVLEQWSDAKADTLSLEQANLILNFGHSKEMLANEGEMSVNSLLTKKLADMTRRYDPSRPVTAGCNEPNPGNHLFRSGALDIIGYNYHDDWFKDVPKNFPGKPFIITESVSALMTRGYYRMPSDSMFIWPKRWDIPFYDESFSCSSYDNCHVPWGNTHEGTLRHVEENDFIMGQFIWTGFDYLGEPTPYGWPARSSYFGIVDLAGFPKDVYYMYQSQWRPDKTVLHLFPHWNWEDGQEIDMWAYYNNADEVELFVNGESQGVRHPEPGKYHSSWRVTYHPGAVSIVSRKDGKEVARQEIKTASAPAAIRLTPDRSVITADGKDLCYVTAEIVDKDGNVCPTADNEITFTVNGAGANVGVDNGSPISLERFKADHRKAFNGKALLIVQNDGNTGDITIEATSPGLSEAKSIVKTKH